MKKAFAFPGQGAQKEKMGLSLFPLFPEETHKASALLGYDVSEFLSKADGELLKQTEYTQPLIFLVSALSYLWFIKQGELPDVVLGHSLGEYTALYAAGVLTFETALELVKKRALFMKEAGEKSRGGLIAILGKRKEEISLSSLPCPIYLANYNEERQIVVATDEKGLTLLPEKLREEKIKFRILAVSAPFHSPFMDSAAAAFKPWIEKAFFAEPRCPVISNVTGRLVFSAQELRENLLRQLNHPVLWYESMLTLQKAGIDTFVEIGPGHILASIARRFNPSWHILKVEETEKQALP